MLHANQLALPSLTGCCCCYRNPPSQAQGLHLPHAAPELAQYKAAAPPPPPPAPAALLGFSSAQAAQLAISVLNSHGWDVEAAILQLINMAAQRVHALRGTN